VEFRHISVMSAEVLHYLAPQSGKVYVDGTLGGGGHARQILEASAPDGILIGFDRDADALKAASENLATYESRVRLFHCNFADMAEKFVQLGVSGIDGFLLDLGVSSFQLDKGERGFSFQQDAPLDMRMDGTSGETAADLINHLSERELAKIIRDYGEERWAVRIAAHIVQARIESPVETTLQLADIIKGAIPRAKWEERLHPATRTFQALRIAVNDELGSLEQGLRAAIKMLNRGGRIAVISFHSLEDRIVKNIFRDAATGCICPKEVPVCICGRTPQLKKVTGKPVLPGREEVLSNPRSRSAKLRVAEKL
jgi:16S rRNA (cytosine1402-N4)-methyltransferase